MGKKLFSSILVPVDFSPCSEEAFRVAMAMAKTFQAEVLLLRPDRLADPRRDEMEDDELRVMLPGDGVGEADGELRVRAAANGDEGFGMGDEAVDGADERVGTEHDRDRGPDRGRREVAQPRVGDAVVEQQIGREAVLRRRPAPLR